MGKGITGLDRTQIARLVEMLEGYSQPGPNWP